MIIVKNNIIPFKGFKAIYLFGFLFTRGDLTETQLNHEKIHERQAIELLFVFFYLWYIIEWIVRLFRPGNAYKNVSFEREAYENEGNPVYLNCREWFSFVKYLRP